MLNNCLTVCSNVCDNSLIIGSSRGILCDHLKPQSIFKSIDLVYKMNKNKRMKIIEHVKNFALKIFIRKNDKFIFRCNKELIAFMRTTLSYIKSLFFRIISSYRVNDKIL